MSALLKLDERELAAQCMAGVAFDEHIHRYSRVEDDGTIGESFLGVTTVISSVLPNPAAARWTDRHRRVGTVTHAATALDDRGMLDDESVSPVVRGRLSAWRRWRGDNPTYSPVLIEVPVWSDLGYAGTPDRVCVIDGHACILDLKGFINEPYCRLQTAAYALAFTERTGIAIDRRVIVGLKDDGSYTVQVYDENRADRAAWTSVLALCRWYAARGVRL